MLKAFVLMMATMFAVFSLPALADSTEGFSPVADHAIGSGSRDAQALIGGGTSNTLAIAECDRCMYAGLGDKQPLIAMQKYEILRPLKKVTSDKPAWTVYFEVGWQS